MQSNDARHRWVSQFVRIWLIHLALLCSCDFAAGQKIEANYPLDPLTPAELMTVRDVLKSSGKFSPGTNFVWIQLKEPSKDYIKNFKFGAKFPRQASIVAVDYKAKMTYEIIVDIKQAQIISIRSIDNAQPGITAIDVEIAKSVIDSDVDIKKALLDRGVKILRKVSDAVELLYYSIGHDPRFENNRDRLLRIVFAPKHTAMSSPPFDGLEVVVDLYTERVINLYSIPGEAPPSEVSDDILGEVGSSSSDQISSSELPRSNELSVDGNVVTWRNWRFRYGFNLREGLVLYQIAVNDTGRWRSIIYRASVSEVVTAYSDQSNFWSWMENFDEGSSGLGYRSVAAEPGREVPGNAIARNAVLPDVSKAAFSANLPNRIYIYEQHNSNLIYYRQGERVYQAPDNSLVIGFISALGNYDYLFNWVFKQDGSFSFEVDLAGEVLTKSVAARKCQVCQLILATSGGKSGNYLPNGDDRYGTLVYPNIVAVGHQHWFNLRLDFDVDGTNNAVMENYVDRVARSSKSQGGGVFEEGHRILARALDARRDIDDGESRTWTIYNPNSVNEFGRPAGYTIVPGENATSKFPRARRKGSVGFTFHHFWATPFRENELYAAGEYPNQASDNYRDTLYHYANDDSIYNKDIVVWYSVGEIHVPRPEDFPIMSDAKLTVTFVPDGFFMRNGALKEGAEKARP